MIPNGLLITNKSIIPDFYSNDSYTKTYHTIYNWCLDNGIIPPERNDTIITNADGTITRRNSLLMNITSRLDGEDICSWLSDKIIKKPEKLSLGYIATILNIHISNETTDYDITL